MDASKTKYTALDAFACKHSACKLDYMVGELVEEVKTVLESATGFKFQKRSVMMHRGYYARVKSQQKVISSLLESESATSQLQILLLGSGYDTLGLETLRSYTNRARIFEVDFPDIIECKKSVLRSNLEKLPETISEIYAEFPSGNGCSFGSSLTLLGSDLRNPAALVSLFHESSFDPTIPTLVITECVLVYLTGPQSDALVDAVSTLVPSSTPLMWMTYDMINPQDAYGQMMVKNLRSAGFSLPGFIDYPSREAQVQRFQSWTAAYSQDMLKIFRFFLPEEDKERMLRLESLDEVDEWNLLMSHYALTLAIRAPPPAEAADSTRHGEMVESMLAMIGILSELEGRKNTDVKIVKFD